MNVILLVFGCNGTLDGAGIGISNHNAELTISYDISNETSIMLMAESSELLVVKEVLDPDGKSVLLWNDWKQSPYSISNALVLSSREIAFNWPIREEDAQIYEGKWKFVLGCYDEEGFPASQTEVQVELKTKNDPLLSVGVFRVWVVIEEATDAQIQEDIRTAVEGWKEIWAGAGIELEFRYSNETVEPLPIIYDGDQKILELRKQGTDAELLVVVGEQFEDAPDILGFSGNVPGSLLPGLRSAVAISWLSNAGTDGEFDEEELQIFSETMAHEAGHYLGLYHPVEINFDKWDALSDTAECQDLISCQQTLKNNLMFPYPVCSGGSCVEQNQLSEQQQMVLHQNTGVDYVP